MISFIICIAALIVGYFFYGRLVDKVFGADPARQTPAYAIKDGVDYVPMPSWKAFMIQFLNIAGTGPIFGAIMGAQFGPASYLWIVLGCIFGGAMHDYFSGMLSLRNNGASLPDLIGKYLGTKTQKVMLCFSGLLLLLVGVVFVYSPAIILSDMTGGGSWSMAIWIGIIFIYYIIATMLPIDKIIGKIYPVFAIALIFMAVSMFFCLVSRWPGIPELWDGLANRQGDIGLKPQSILPCMFITIACGAISGFHATQSPLMARCIKSEKMGRPIFYGAMITEGIVALIWAAVSSYFFFDGGATQIGSDLSASAPTVVNKVAGNWLGGFGAVLALLGVVAAPITSGDTAFRSLRLMVSDAFGIQQKTNVNRILVCLPLFAVAGLLLWYNIANSEGFDTIWRYFGWANQTLACFTLWMISVFLVQSHKKPYFLMSLVPAAFMTAICVTYISTAKIGFNLPVSWNVAIFCTIFTVSLVLFFLWKNKRRSSAVD